VVLAFLLFVSIFGIITGVIANSKGLNFIPWFFFGCALFIVALPCVLMAKPSQQALDAKAIVGGGRKCPACAEIVRQDAKVCRYCGAELGDPALAPNPYEGMASYQKGAKR
jgi:hypothetical protein